jgi:CRP-like cAMP-binding protein
MYDTNFSSQNQLLSSLPSDALDRIRPDLEYVELPRGNSIFKPYQPITHVYFPERSMASIVANTSQGQSTEIGVVGSEGAVGMDVLFGVDSSPHECMIQIADGGWRIPTASIRAEFKRAEALHDVLLRFSHRLMTQISQTTLCNRLHSLDERLSRWLLMCQDRVGMDELNLTQEFLAIMLGVTRVSVTAAASSLQEAGCIRYTRGHITITDRMRLETSACDCYAAVKKEYERG